MPVLAFGIPGSDATAVLMAALLLHGLAPGRELMTDRLPLIFVLIWSLFLSNWVTSLVGVMLVGPLARLTTLRLRVVAPLVFTLAAVGAFADQQRIGDVVVAFASGAAGYYMKKHGWPRIPLVVALLLGAGLELNLHITSRLYALGRIDLAARPIVFALIAANLLIPVVRARRAARAGA